MTAMITSATEMVLQAARAPGRTRTPSPGRALGRAVPRRRGRRNRPAPRRGRASATPRPGTPPTAGSPPRSSGQVSAADTTGLFLGAPAIGFLLSTSPAEFDHLYLQARRNVHRHVLALAHRRTDAAIARIKRGDLATFAEYDLLYGLTGIGAYLLRASPTGGALERVLRYLVALTRPLASGGRGLPGWWVPHDPRRGDSPHFPGGHGNLGAAHGITGPLLLLAQALRRGIEVARPPRRHLDHLRPPRHLAPGHRRGPVVARTPRTPGPRTATHSPTSRRPTELVLRNHRHRTGRTTRRHRTAAHRPPDVLRRRPSPGPERSRPTRQRHRCRPLPRLGRHLPDRQPRRRRRPRRTPSRAAPRARGRAPRTRPA